MPYSVPSYDEWKKTYFAENGLSNISDAFYRYNQLYGDAYQKEKDADFQRIWQGLIGGSINPYDAQAQFVDGQHNLNAEQYEVLVNALNRTSAQEQVEAQKDLQENSTQSVIDVLRKNGMNPGSVISMGSTSTGNAASPDVSQRNIAYERQMQEFSHKNNILRSVISLIGGLGSAGIGGSTILMARNAAAKLAASTIHSAETTIQNFNRKGQLTGSSKTSKTWY